MFLAHISSHRAFLTLTSFALMSAAAMIAPISAGAQTINDLFNTGVDASGTLLADGSIDPHYTQNSGNPDTPNAFVF